jgi:hypothetical protein
LPDYEIIGSQNIAQAGRANSVLKRMTAARLIKISLKVIKHDFS